LTTSRLETPRLKVPKGAVGIGGSQTGIYPLECPSGWNLIGKTPFDIYDPNREDAFFIHACYKLQFFPISNEQFLEMMHVDGSSVSSLLKEFVDDAE
jgi:inhibitor of KinA